MSESHRTRLANERTYLAWWRTGLTTLTVALAAARVIPELSKVETRWPYTVIGVGFALLGIFCIGYGERRRVAIDAAIAENRETPTTGHVTGVITAVGILLGIGITALLLLDA